MKDDDLALDRDTRRREAGFARWFLAGSFGAFVAYLILAVVVDPRALFGTGLVPPAVLHSRKLKQELFRSFLHKGPVDGLVLGSSRSMLVAPAQLERMGCGRWFNFAVDSARSEDYLAVFRWSMEQGARPRHLLIGLDVEALHNAVGNDERLRTTPSLMAALGSSRPDRLRRMLASWVAVSEAVMSDAHARGIVASLLAWSRGTVEKSRFEQDGVMRYLRWENDRKQGRFDLERNIEQSRLEYSKRFADMTALSGDRISALERLLSEAGQAGTQVIIWITPLHPRVVTSLEGESKYRELLRATQSLLSVLGRNPGVRVRDFSDARAFSAGDDGWWDGAHLNEQNAARLTSGLVEDLGCNDF